MNVILPACPCLRNRIAAFGFQTRYFAAHVSGTKSNYGGSLILWAPWFAVIARSNLSWAKYDYHMQADLYRVAFSFFRIGVFLRVQHTRVLQFLSWCAHCLRVQVSSTFSDDVWCVLHEQKKMKHFLLLALGTCTQNSYADQGRDQLAVFCCVGTDRRSTFAMVPERHVEWVFVHDVTVVSRCDLVVFDCFLSPSNTLPNIVLINGRQCRFGDAKRNRPFFSDRSTAEGSASRKSSRPRLHCLERSTKPMCRH